MYVMKKFSLDLQPKGQRFDIRCRQLEKVVNLDENSWTHTKLIMPSFR